MKTPDEIKKGLKCCRGGELGCSECPYDGECHLPFGNDPEVDALAYIQQLEAQAPRWISVKERLPEKKQRVMVYTVQGTYRIGVFSFVGDKGAVWFKCDKSCITVTHWMPLPEPPKEEA